MNRSVQQLEPCRGQLGEAARQARPVSARRRRRLARWIRRTANRSPDRHRAPSRFELVLRHRAAAVRMELLAVADLLESSDDPDPSCVADLERLLSDGCGSPLLNADVHLSELRATLYYARCRLNRITRDGHGR